MTIGAMNNPIKDAKEEVERIAKGGFDFVDFTYELPATPHSADSIKEIIRNYGISVIGHTNPTLPMVYPLPSVRSACISELKKSILFLRDIGAKKINIHPFYYNAHLNPDDVTEQNILVLKEMAHFCKENDLQLMLENFRFPFSSTRSFIRIMKEVPNLKIHLDIAHFNLEANFETEIEKFLNVFRSEIEHCHIHDNNGKLDEHLPLGCGNINWMKVVQLLKNSGYDKTFTLEVFAKDPAYLLYSKKRWQELWDCA